MTMTALASFASQLILAAEDAGHGEEGHGDDSAEVVGEVQRMSHWVRSLTMTSIGQ